DLDPEGGGVTGTVDAHRPALEQDLPGVERVDAADALDQRGLSRPVVADQRGHLPGRHHEIYLAQYLHRAEPLVDAAHLQQRRGGHAAPFAVPPAPFAARWPG